MKGSRCLRHKQLHLLASRISLCYKDASREDLEDKNHPCISTTAVPEVESWSVLLCWGGLAEVKPCALYPAAEAGERARLCHSLLPVANPGTEPSTCNAILWNILLSSILVICLIGTQTIIWQASLVSF